MIEGSSLKSRQYMAQGLPWIYAYDDTDLTGEEEFTLKIPNSEDNVYKSIEDIKTFINKCFQNKSFRIKSREFARKHLDVSLKEANRIKFLKSLTQGTEC